MSILIAPVAFDPNDVDIYYNPEHMKELEENLLNYLIKDITKRCDEHKFPLLHQKEMALMGDEPLWKERRNSTLLKLNELYQTSSKKLEGFDNAPLLSITAMFKLIVDTIEKGLDNFHITMLSVEGVQLMNQISACSNGEELTNLICKHPIFPFGK